MQLRAADVRALAYALCVLAAVAAAPVRAQAPAAGEQAQMPAQYHPDTGDAWLDAQLADINAYASRYPESFLDELVRYAGISYPYVSALLKEQGWPGGDIYLACFLGQAMETGCRPLVRALAADRRAGWSVALAQLPSPPQRLQWRAVRHGLVDSYRRWDRPITPDAVLRRQLADKAATAKAAR